MTEPASVLNYYLYNHVSKVVYYTEELPTELGILQNLGASDNPNRKTIMAHLVRNAGPEVDKQGLRLRPLP